MPKGFAKPPKKYPPNGRWFSSYNWENGFYGTSEEIKRQEQQHIAQVRAQVRDKCLRDGVSEGIEDLTPWDISFKGKRGEA